MPHGFLQSLDSIRRDLVHAARSLAKEKVFSLVCIASLGIGMGAVVALVTFGRAIMAPARGINTEGLTEILVLPQGPLRIKAGVWALEQWSYPDYRALREADTGMAITGWMQDTAEIGTRTPGDDAALPQVGTLYVSANYFSTMGVTLARGPGFDPAVDDATLGEPRVIVSDDFWRNRMNSDPEAVGKTVIVAGVPHTVVGIAPPDFRGHFHFFNASAMLFIPLERHPRLTSTPGLRDDRTVDWIRMHGRLNEGVDMTRANGLVTAAAATLAKKFPSTNEFKSATVEPYASLGAAGRPESRRVLSIMLGLAGSVLLIVCVNISGMMMVRGTNRERELCIRAALGAARRRLIQHLFFEAMFLAMVGAAIAGLVLFGIPAAIFWYLGFPVPQEIDLDPAGVAIASGLCLVVSMLFGLLPAVRFSRPNLNMAMKDDTGVGGRRAIRMHRVAAAVQIGIAVPFLVISGVMLDRTRTADFGFPTDGIAGAKLPMPQGSEQDAGFTIRRVRDNLRQASGVRSVAVAEGMPIDFDYREFRVAASSGERFVTAHVTHVGEDFLETVGAPLLRGRSITAEDRVTGARVAVISDPLAALLFPGAEPIGERVKVTLDESREEEFTIVGVSGDFATSQLTTIRPQILLPLPDVSTVASAKVETPARSVFLIARGAPGDEPRLRSALEGVLRELGVEPLPGVAFPGIVTGGDMVEKSIGDLISESTAVGIAGGLVLVLAALGIIGVVGFMVATRTREIAVRIALGSTRLGVFGLMLADIVKLVIPGVVGGLMIGSVLIRTMEDVMGTPLTLGPDPLGMMEPVIYAGASAIAITAALLAALPAARRATTVQPMVAMRTE